MFLFLGIIEHRVLNIVVFIAPRKVGTIFEMLVGVQFHFPPFFNFAAKLVRY